MEAERKKSVESKLLTPEQTADLLQIQPATLARWRWAGGGPRFVKIGGRVRYAESDIAPFIQAGVRTSTSDLRECPLQRIDPGEYGVPSRPISTWPRPPMCQRIRSRLRKKRRIGLRVLGIMQRLRSDFLCNNIPGGSSMSFLVSAASRLV